MTILFMPYALIITHRHWTSHAPLIGTLVRVLYVTAIAYEIALALGTVPLFLGAVGYIVSWKACLYFFGALVLSDTAHRFCDWLSDRIGGKRKR